jgi:hypothetical protein
MSRWLKTTAQVRISNSGPRYTFKVNLRNKDNPQITRVATLDYEIRQAWHSSPAAHVTAYDGEGNAIESLQGVVSVLPRSLMEMRPDENLSNALCQLGLPGGSTCIRDNYLLREYPLFHEMCELNDIGICVNVEGKSALTRRLTLTSLAECKEMRDNAIQYNNMLLNIKSAATTHAAPSYST